MNHRMNAVPGSQKLLLIALAFALSLSLVAISFAWFGALFDVSNEEFSGASIASYFAGGDGSQEDPYLITEKYHIYNLAWLQYLGIFNRDEDQDGKIDQQYYFRLENDVDMDGLVIPPIGTEEMPFIGNFNGQGHCISGAVVSNFVSETAGDGGIEQMPSYIEKIDTTITVDGKVQNDKAIVGFFGVIGDWDYSLDGLADDKTEGDASGDGSEPEIQGGVVNKVYDLKLDDLTIRTDTKQSLIGLLAGYVNGSVVNVGVGESRLVIGDSVIPLSDVSGIDVQLMVSRFSLIGAYDEENVAWPDQPILGGFGDSIALRDMYTQLRSIYKQAENFSYITAETFTYVDGVLQEDLYESTPTSSGGKLIHVDLGSAGNYIFSTRTDNSENYTYLYGDTYRKTVTRKYLETRNAFSIYLGNNYLSLNSSNNVASENASQAQAWSWDDEGHLYTIVGVTAAGGSPRTYYLVRNSSGNVAVSQTPSTVWNLESVGTDIGRIYCVVNGVNQYLFCRNGTWVLDTVRREVEVYSGYTISYQASNGTVSYLNLTDSGGLSRGTSEETPTLWTFSNPSSRSGYISAINSNGTTYYLRAQRSGNQYKLSATTSTYYRTSWSNANDALYYNFGNSRVRYLGISDDAWALIADENAAQLSISYTEREVVVEEFVESDYNINVSEDFDVQDVVKITSTQERGYDTNATWFPLATENNADGDKVVSNSNTGYVVSGSDYQQSGNEAPRRSGNIRVSRYAKDSSSNPDIANSLSDDGSLSHNILSISYRNYGSSLEKPVFSAIGSKGDAENDFGFVRYGDSFDKLSATLGYDSYVYGLHFMNATIDIQDRITINEARVVTAKGNKYFETGYELPRNAITFNLPEAGYVNFFAGTYFPDNKTFFSLYEIERDPQGMKLEAIKEIVAIYGVLDGGYIDERYPYVYEYLNSETGETYFEEDLPENYSLVFSCDWINDAQKIDMQESYVYYFEIPVNEGEYALGSVANSDGAYLIYLDLAANGTRRVSSTAAHTMTGLNFLHDEALSDPDFDIQNYPIVALGVAFDGMTANHQGVSIMYNRESSSVMTYDVTGAGSGAFDLNFMTGGGKAEFLEKDLSSLSAFVSDDVWIQRRKEDFS